ncbi:YbbR domain-containing protein [Clostridium acidisoli DSM 12555]|uniref:YbbR domain-containing protein n=1 Tax=Clostridium acidisoli DSM 12555 TaxID=1121291 RepID=A0A1W1XSY8_9CLOT|nr:CdaR family protein [Clostridium acidisoli]SMC27079.1 YbbR domain-containing protein [Clostridium acidisoli DSM 12555]
MEKKNNRQILIRICCIIASFCLWLYISNVENPISTYVIRNVPVKLINVDALDQSKLTVLPNQKFSVSINVRGTSLELMKIKASDFKIVADMSQYAVKEGENRIPVQIVHYPSNVNIENSSNMWTDVEIDKLYEKNVPIKVKVEGKTRAGYYYLEPALSQADATISGASKYASMISNVVANVNVENLNKDLEIEPKLQAVDKNGKIIDNISIKPQKITVTVPIKKSKSVGINVVTQGKPPSGIDIKTITSVDEGVDIIGDYDKVKDISTINTKPIDLGSISKSNIISVKLDLPEGISTLSGKNSVDVKIDVDEVIQKTVAANVNIINLPQGFTSAQDNNSVNVTLSGDATIINTINAADVKAVVDASSFKEGVNSGKISVTLPSGVTSTGNSPDTINVTLTKK